jgi:metacaspase-1
LVFHFSGHGAQKPDPNGYEEDGMNECILPMDFNYTDVITDDLMQSIMVRNLPECVKLTAVMDCCHSGTGLDLPYEWTPGRMAWREETNPYHTRGDVQLLSGCSDRGVACDR